VVVSDTIVQLIAKASVSVIRFTHLVNDLLETTSLEQGQLSLNCGWFKISDIIDSCCENVSLQGKYYLSYVGDKHISVYGDHYKIEQVIVNFVNNAVKYAPESEEVTLLVEDFQSSIKISIVDKGRGISEEEQPHLFDRYYRVAKENVTHDGGLGLGLYICAEIVRRYGGDISVHSTLGEGSTFWFSLPAGPTIG
jgi:two-component system sensor histidine kinase VicK